jgi:hypothetical protein
MLLFYAENWSKNWGKNVAFLCRKLIKKLR